MQIHINTVVSREGRGNDQEGREGGRREGGRDGGRGRGKGRKGRREGMRKGKITSAQNRAVMYTYNIWLICAL